MAKPTDTEYFCTIYNSFPGEFMVSLVFLHFAKSEKVAIVFFAKNNLYYNLYFSV